MPTTCRYGSLISVSICSCQPEGGAYKSNAPFKGDTTQRVDYKKWPTEKPHMHEPEQYTKPQGDFDFNTTNHIDYTKKPLTVRKAHRPEARKSAPGNFDGTTNYNTDYRKWTPVDQVELSIVDIILTLRPLLSCSQFIILRHQQPEGQELKANVVRLENVMA